MDCGDSAVVLNKFVRSERSRISTGGASVLKLAWLQDSLIQHGRSATIVVAIDNTSPTCTSWSGSDLWKYLESRIKLDFEGEIR
jgi:hypothetical protein